MSASRDDRPVGTGRTSYDLSFFDGDNEFERRSIAEGRVRVVERRQAEQRFRDTFEDFVVAFASDAISDEEFARDFTYERLLELDRGLEQRGGLSATQMTQLLRPARVEGELCSICLETSVASERVVVLRCSHSFHCRCLQSWFVAHRTCPNCRCDVLLAESQREAS